MSSRKSVGLSRRSFLATSGATLGAAQIGLAGRPAWAQETTLRIAAGEADGARGTMDPALSTSDPDAGRISLAFERMVILDENFVPQPQLAEDWEPDETGQEWTFRLVQGVKFHDGSEMTAEDVLFSYKRLFDSELGSPAVDAMSEVDPEQIEALDDYTVRFTLKSPIVEFPQLIANRFTYIAKAGQSADDLRTRGIGTGPFKVERFVPGEEPSVFVRHEAYRRSGLPKVDRVEMRAIPDAAARIAAIQAGQVDLVWDLPRVGIDGLEEDDNANVVSTRSPFVLTLSCWCDTPPFDDVRVRMAMKLVVDRERMLQLVLGGRGQLGNDNPVAPWMRYALDAPVRERDVEHARALLAEAGHPDGIDLELHTSEVTPGFTQMATVYKAMAADAGIRVELVQSPGDDYWSNIWLNEPFICSSWSGRPADDALSVAYLSDADWNETNWSNEEFDSLIREARRTVDDDERTRLYRRAQEILREDGGAIIPMFPDAIGATRANVTGWSLHPQQYSKDFSEVEIA